jgi:hypothetical protein
MKREKTSNAWLTGTPIRLFRLDLSSSVSAVKEVPSRLCEGGLWRRVSKKKIVFPTLSEFDMESPAPFAD